MVMSATYSVAPAEPKDDYRAVLDDCIQIGRRPLLTLGDIPSATGQDPARDYGLYTRSLLLAITLVREIGAEPTAEYAQRRRVARAEIIRTVQDNIQHHTHGTRAIELEREFLDRLQDPDLEADIRRTRPIHEIVADLCRDLGVPPPGDIPEHYRRRTSADIVALHKLAARPSRRRSWRRKHRGPSAPKAPILRLEPLPRDDR